MCAKDGTRRDVYDDESSGQFSHRAVHFALQLRWNCRVAGVQRESHEHGEKERHCYHQPLYGREVHWT